MRWSASARLGSSPCPWLQTREEPMAKRLSVLVALGALLAGTAAAQDAQRVLRAAADAMGDPSNVRYSGTGWVANVGQSYTPDDDWPRFEVTTYTRTIDYDNRSSREEYTRRQGNYPPQGGGTPLQEVQRRVFLTNGDYSWNMNGPNPAPQLAAAEVRQLDIWMSPHGFLKAAADASDAMAVSLMLQGRDLTKSCPSQRWTSTASTARSTKTSWSSASKPGRCEPHFR